MLFSTFTELVLQWIVMFCHPWDTVRNRRTVECRLQSVLGASCVQSCEALIWDKLKLKLLIHPFLAWPKEILIHITAIKYDINPSILLSFHSRSLFFCQSVIQAWFTGATLWAAIRVSAVACCRTINCFRIQGHWIFKRTDSTCRPIIIAWKEKLKLLFVKKIND